MLLPINDVGKTYAETTSLFTLFTFSWREHGEHRERP